MKIAAFNVKRLGLKKVKDESVVPYLIKIMSQYSVVVILEVWDMSGEVMETLLQKLNSSSCNQSNPFSMTTSAKLKRDTYKEQYVCFYREADVTLRACYKHPDDQVGNVNALDRKPYILRFHCPNTILGSMVLILVHTKPADAERELRHLYDVVQAVKKKWRTRKIVIVGDFNADGRYLSQVQKSNIQICSPPYHWLMRDDVDTTSSKCTDNTYGRVVVFGKVTLRAVVPDSAKPFNFQREFNLTDEQALRISDHYPVEVELIKTRGGRLRRRKFKASHLWA
ncbi:deoxyribonuclease-1-like [Halichoeres trimaculatus]|uniref:deoxyribonuclease-1-like n=1 Tax=Halichoeres trimaculatus TaxID=147232 RepID=UPI003D9DB501